MCSWTLQQSRRQKFVLELPSTADRSRLWCHFLPELHAWNTVRILQLLEIILEINVSSVAHAIFQLYLIFYRPNIDHSTCSACDPGTYNDRPGQLCIPCSAGYYANDTGFQNCTACPVATFSNSGSTNCSTCPLGTYNDIPGNGACIPCNPGSYGNQTGLVNCFSCPVGTWSSYNAKNCSLCPAGSYSNTTNTSVCPFCWPGSFTNYTGATTCDLCPPGKTNSLLYNCLNITRLLF
jgi:hypothetical protein